MYNSLKTLTLILVLSTVSVFAASDVIEAKPVPANTVAFTSPIAVTVPVTAPAVTTPVVTTPIIPVIPVVTPPPTQSPVTYIVSNVLSVLQVPITILLTTLLSAALVSVAKHFNVQVSATQQQMVSDAAHMAAAKTEAWATAQKDVPSSNDKLNYAVNVLKTVGNNSAVQNYTNTQLSTIIEHAVYNMFGQTDPNDPVVSKA